MSNSELLRAGFEAWNRDDCDGWLELLHPDVEISTSGIFPDFAPVYCGHAQAAKFWRRLREPWEEFRIEIEEITEDRESATGAIRFRARGTDSGVEVDMRFGTGIRIRDGLATDLVNRRTAEEAREALREKRAAAPSPEPRPGSRVVN
jgi:ketosteroid isomerase-like protein